MIYSSKTEKFINMPFSYLPEYEPDLLIDSRAAREKAFLCIRNEKNSS